MKYDSTILQYKSINQMMKSASDLEERINNHIIFSHDNESDDEIKDEVLTGLNICIGRLITTLYHILNLILLSSFTALYVFNILSLIDVSPSYVHSLCSVSYMWEYMMVDVICLGIFALYWLFKDYEDSKNVIVLGAVIQCGLTVWGANEICSVSCANQLSHTLLYTMAVINVCIVVGMFFLGVLTAIWKQWL